MKYIAAAVYHRVRAYSWRHIHVFFVRILIVTTILHNLCMIDLRWSYFVLQFVPHPNFSLPNSSALISKKDRKSTLDVHISVTNDEICPEMIKLTFKYLIAKILSGFWSPFNYFYYNHDSLWKLLNGFSQGIRSRNSVAKSMLFITLSAWWLKFEKYYRYFLVARMKYEVLIVTLANGIIQALSQKFLVTEILVSTLFLTLFYQSFMK